MDIGYRKYVTAYIDFLDNISNAIDVSLYENMDKSIGDLINEVLTFVHENFPTILISKDELLNKVKSIYIQKTEIYKKDLIYKVSQTKYDLGGSFSLSKIKEYMKKGNKDIKISFTSVSYGTNASFKDTVINISSDIFGTIQRSSNNNLMFAKKTKETKEQIEEIVLKHYKEFMNDFANELMKKALNPLEEYKKNVENYVEKTNEDIIKEYKSV